MLFLFHTCRVSHAFMWHVNWHGCTIFIMHCELCICDTTYRLFLVRIGYTQELYSLYKICKYVYLKYVWSCWIKITFFIFSQHVIIYHCHLSFAHTAILTPARLWRTPQRFSWKNSLSAALHHREGEQCDFPQRFQFHFCKRKEPRKRKLPLPLSPSLPLAVYSSLTFV